jgi:hypothetical protein
MKRWRAICLILGLSCIGFAKAGQYFQDFSKYEAGATQFDDGAILVSSDLGQSAVLQDADRKELRLTGAQTGVRSAFALPDLNAQRRIYAFSAKWNTSLAANFPDGGAGFSFTFGQIGGIDLIPPDFAQETGYGRGICLSVQTGGASPGFYLLVNGETLASKPFVSATQWGVNNDARPLFEVDWNYTNGVSVKVDGLPVFTKVPTPAFSPQVDDRFVWAARAGEFGEEVVLDNIAVVTGGNLARLAGSGFFSSQRNPNYGPMKAYDDDNDSEFAVFNAQSGFVGGNVSPARALMFYSLTSGIDAPDPHNWAIEGALASTGPWTTVAAGDWNFARRKETRTWPVTNGVDAFTSFRISFPTNNLTTLSTYIGDVRLFEFKPVQPPHAVEIVRSAVDSFAITFAGAASSNYVAQFTTNFSQWTDFNTNAVPGLWSVTDSNTTNTTRFYRLRSY